MKKLLEKFLNLFFPNKSKEIKRQAFIERQKAIAEYEKAKWQREQYLKKYSRKGGFIKSGSNNNK